MIAFIKEHKKDMLGIGIVGVVIVPIFVYFLSVLTIFPNGGNDWAGFWGGYLGSVIGGVITLYVMWRTLEDEKKTKKREEKILFFNELIKVWAVLYATLGNLELTVNKFTKTKKEEDYCDALLINNKVCEQSMQLKLLISTRNKQFLLSELYAKNEEMSNCVNEMMNIVEKRFLDNQQINKVNKLIEKADEYEKQFTTCLEDTIKNGIGEEV